MTTIGGIILACSVAHIVNGAKGVPLRLTRYADVTMNLTEALAGAAGRWPQKTALIEGDAVISYGGLVEKIAGFAAQLPAPRGVAGSRIGVSCPNSINYVPLPYAPWPAHPPGAAVP